MNIPEDMKKILEDLRIQESGASLAGSRIHRNPSEYDITTRYGIYRYANPKAKIFEYIDTIARNMGLTKPSTQWTISDYISVQNKMDFDTELYYTYLFIKDYFSVTLKNGTKLNIDLDKFDTETKKAVISLGWNSMKLCVKCLQSTINEFFIEEYIPGYNKTNVIACDGVYGPGTDKVLNIVLDYINKQPNKELSIRFFHRFLNNAKTYYIKLALGNKNNLLQYLNGWNNRVDNLI